MTGLASVCSAAAAAPTAAPVTPPVDGRQTLAWPTLVRGIAILVWLTATFLLWGDPSARPALLLVGAVVVWTLEVAPDYVVALALVVVWNFTAAGPLAASVAGFTSPTWFLLIGILALVAALTRSGLLERLALRLLLTFPPTFRGQATALTLGGLLVTPFLPLIVGRSAMAAPFAVQLARAMGFAPGSRPAVGLGLAAFVGAGLLSPCFLSGATINMIAWSLLPDAARPGWMAWASAALPMTLVLVVGSLSIILVAYRPALDQPIPREVLERRLAERGPASTGEWITGMVATAVLVGFIAAPSLAVDSAWVVCAGALTLAGIGILPRETFRAAIDWPLVLFIGVILGLPKMIDHTGFAAALVAWLPTVLPWTGGAYSAVVALFLVATAARFALSEWVGVPLLTVTLLPIGVGAGLHPWVVALIVLASANLWLLPYQFTSYAAFYAGSEGALFTHRQVRGFSAAFLGLTAVGLLASIPLWRVLGLVGS